LDFKRNVRADCLKGEGGNPEEKIDATSMENEQHCDRGGEGGGKKGRVETV